jgi:RHS repeat-associated protein
MLQQVQSKKANDTFRNYANSFNYTAAGAVSSVRLGNGKWENTAFNSRLQPTQIGLGNSATDRSLLKLDFTYNTAGQNDNNGNVLSQTITVGAAGGTPGFTAVQTYTYDALNRINDAKENIDGNPAANWKQTFEYDRYGNRRFNELTTTTITKNCTSGSNAVVCAADVAAVNPTIDQTNNRLDGYTFDTAGNTKIDALNRQFVYDAENKQIEVKDSQSNSIGKYYYDGDGKRVKKEAGNETTVFIYDAAGKLVAEYSNQTSANPQISYLTSDHLGSPRINTDASGQVTARHDYLPFGEEIQRASYGNDDVRKQFTGYEKDEETDLDFAQARYYLKYFGRFSSADPIYESANPKVPQSWNRYIYVINNPLLFIDPMGLSGCDPLTDPGCKTDTPPIPKECSDCVYATDENGKPFLARADGTPFLPGEVVNVSINGSQKAENEALGNRKKGNWNLWDNVLKPAGKAVGGAIVGGVAAIVGGGTAGGTAGGTGGVTAAAAVSSSGIITTVSSEVSGQTGDVDLSSTFTRIQNGLSDPHANDGTTFGNREQILPVQSDPNYYTEFVVRTPGINHAGPRRVITGNGGEVYYTPDHYGTFVPLNDAALNCGCGPESSTNP